MYFLCSRSPNAFFLFENNEDLLDLDRYEDRANELSVFPLSSTRRFKADFWLDSSLMLSGFIRWSLDSLFGTDLRI